MRRKGRRRRNVRNTIRRRSIRKNWIRIVRKKRRNHIPMRSERRWKRRRTRSRTRRKGRRKDMRRRKGDIASQGNMDDKYGVKNCQRETYREA